MTGRCRKYVELIIGVFTMTDNYRKYVALMTGKCTMAKKTHQKKKKKTEILKYPH